MYTGFVLSLSSSTPPAPAPSAPAPLALVVGATFVRAPAQLSASCWSASGAHSSKGEKNNKKKIEKKKKINYGPLRKPHVDLALSSQSHASDALIIFAMQCFPTFLLLLEVLANWSSLILLRVVVARFHQDFSHIFKWLIKYLILMPQGPIET